MAVQLFLSCVSDEFGVYRNELRRALTRPNVEVKIQEDFKALGGDTLMKLDGIDGGDRRPGLPRLVRVRDDGDWVTLNFRFGRRATVDRTAGNEGIAGVDACLGRLCPPFSELGSGAERLIFT